MELAVTKRMRKRMVAIFSIFNNLSLRATRCLLFWSGPFYFYFFDLTNGPYASGGYHVDIVQHRKSVHFRFQESVFAFLFALTLSLSLPKHLKTYYSGRP
jgi:hypothetical protein